MGLFDLFKKVLKREIEPSGIGDTVKEIYSKEGLDIESLQKNVSEGIGGKLAGKELVGTVERYNGSSEIEALESVEMENKKRFIPFGSLLKDKSGMLLKKGDRIVGKGVDSYTLYIPGYNSSRLQKFYGEAKEFAGNITGEERVQKLMKFVHDNIEHEVGWEGQTIEQQKNSGFIKKEVSLIRSIFLGKGVCKEQAAVLSMMLRMEGLENEFIRGKPEITSPLFGSLPMEKRGGRHAWVKVKLGNDYYYVDPTNEFFEKYDSGLLKYKLHEDSGYYPRSDGTFVRMNESRFVPLGSLLRDTSGTFPRREKEETAKTGISERIKKQIEGTEDYPESKEFFQRAALEAGKEEYGRGAKSLDEVAKDITLQLAEFWGIPSSLQIQAFVPKVKVCGKEEYKKLIGEEDADIDKDVPVATYTKFSWGNVYSHCIVVNREWFSNMLSSNLMFSIKPVLAEEIGHFIQNTVEASTGKPDIFVKEFFGMISRLYIAEQSSELFKGEYRNLFNSAIEFSAKFERIKNLIRYYESEVQPNNPQFEARNAEISEKISELKSSLDHLAYHPAVAYYYEIRKMSSQDRYKLLNMNFTDLKNYVIGPKMRELEAIRLKVMQRKQTTAERERNLQSYPESDQFFENVGKTAAIERAASEAIGYKQEEIGYGLEVAKAGLIREANKGLEGSSGFFQRVASEIGKAAYGRVAEAVTKLEQHETAIETGEVMEEYPEEEPAEEEYQETEEQEQAQGEYEQPEEEQEEQYGPESEQAPQQPKISISIPKKVPKKIAKKLESMGVKLPKKMIKK